MGALEDICVLCGLVLCRFVLQRGNNGDGCQLASTLCKYYLRKGDFYPELGKGATSEVASVSSDLLMCGGGVPVF